MSVCLVKRAAGAKVICMGTVTAMVLMLACGLGRAAEHEGENRLINGGFEEGQRPWGNNISPATVTVVIGAPPHNVHSGRQSVRLRSEGNNWAHFYQSTRHAAGRMYELSFWARAGEPVLDDDGQPIEPGVEAYIYQYGNPDISLTSKFLHTTQLLKAQPVTGQWRRFSVQFTTSEGVGVRDFSAALGMRAEVLFDDVVLRELDTFREARILYLPFDGSFEAAEAGGKGRPEVRGRPEFVEGKQGQAASFTDNANLIFDAEANFDQAEGTVAMWIRPYWPNDDGVPHCFVEVPMGPELFTDGGFVMTKGWSTGVQPNLAYFYNSPGHYHISGARSFEANQWTHIAFSWSASKGILQLFQDGELTSIEKYARIEPPPASKGRSLVIGARLGGKSAEKTDKGKFFGQIPRHLPEMGGDGADAALDELMIFNRALTPAEVARLVGKEAKQAVEIEPMEAPHVNRLEAQLKTPHVPFGRPLAVEPVRAFFVAAVQGSNACRDVVELAQRFDVDFSAATIWYPWTLGYAPAYFRQWKGTSLAEKADEIVERLGEDPEVIVLANVIYSKLPRNVHDAIMGKVRAGAGLVITAPGKLPAGYEPDGAAHEGNDGQADDGRDEILTGVPLANLPEFFPDQDLAEHERAANGVRAYKVGKGRVVVIRWRQEEVPEGEGWEGLAPLAAGGRWTRQFEHRYNYHLSVVGKALLWASGRDLRARWSSLPTDGAKLQRTELPKENMAIGVTWRGDAGQPATLAATVRDPLGHVESSAEHAVTLASGANAIPVSLPTLRHGLHFLDLVFSTEAGVENWATVSFHVEGADRIINVATELEHYERGRTVRGTVKFEGAIAEAAQLNVRTRDTNERIYSRAAVPVAAGMKEVAFEISVDRPTTLASHIEVELVRDGEVISNGDAVVFVPKRNFDGFLSVLWCDIVNEGVGQVALRQARKAGFDAVYHWAGQCGDFENDAMADLMPVQYCCRITLRPDARGQAKGMPGQGRLDPEFQKWVQRVAKGTEASMPLGPPYYSLGDENHFQFGIGYSPYELEAFGQFLAKRHGAIKHLNQEYGADYKTFEEVPRYKESDAIAKDLIPALVDHRLGTDDEWANIHHQLSREIRKLDPDARVGAEGSEAGDMERMLDGVQIWGPYGDDVLLRSLARKDLLASHWWAGLEQGPEDCTKLWTWMIRGFINYHQFFCALHIDGAMFNVDYSYRPFFEKLLPELQQINAGPALMLRDMEVISDDTIAVHWSRTSEHASFALKSLGTTQSSRSNLVKTFDLLSRDYRYISSRQIVGGWLGKPQAKILFLPASHAMSQATADDITEFVREGGTVVADFLPALNEFGRRLPEGRLDKLFGATCGGKTSPASIRDMGIDATVNGHPVRVVCPRTVGHADVTATTAKALAPDQAVPLMLVNEVGRGRAILLNFDLSRCSRSQRADFIASLLKATGADPDYRLTTAPPETQLSVSRRGGVTLVGVILPKDAAEDAGVAWEQPMHVYDVRSGNYLGKMNEIAIPAAEELQRVHLYALHRSPVAAVEVQSAKRVNRGETLVLKVGVRFRDAAVKPIDRIVRVDVADPEGNMIIHYRSFVTLTGPTGDSQIPFAFNDPPGQWTITATDVATGVASTRTVQLKP